MAELAVDKKKVGVVMHEFPALISERLGATGVVAVLMIDDLASAVPLAQALKSGGVDAMELTLRTPVAFDALRAIRAEVPDMLAGLGTILNTDQVQEAVSAGATFGVAPGTNPDVVRAAWEQGLPFAPGIATPSDIEMALSLGCRLLKFFPAEPSGGLPYLKSIAAPFQHLDVRFMPLGGVNVDNMKTYLSDASVLAVGGSWLAPRDMIKAADWTAIRARAEAASRIVKATP